MLPSSNFTNRLAKLSRGAAAAALLLLPTAATAQWRLDANFDPGQGASELVWSARGQADGGVLAVGRFTQAGGAPRGSIARFLPDGSLDPYFAPAANGTVMAVLPLRGGGILVGGSFNQIDGRPITGLARLDGSGRLDTSFQPQIAGTVFQVLEQADGKILAAGFFNQAGGAPCGSIVRLLPDGSRDPGFDAGWGADGFVLAMALDGSGRILVGGYFNWLNGQPRTRLARLLPDGSVDPGFQPSANAPVWAIAQQPDGKILVGGEFTQLNGQPAGYLGRLLASGAVDPSWQNGAGADAAVSALAIEGGGHILAGGAFLSIGGASRSRLARLSPTGAVDSSFALGADGPVHSLALQPNGDLLAAGDFRQLGGVPRVRVARLERQTGYDAAFLPPLRPPAKGSLSIATLQPLRDQRILVGGTFAAQPSPNNNLVRLHPNGSLDTGFYANPSGPVTAAIEQRDGKIVVSGTFDNIGGGFQPFLARLLPDGRLDRSFNPGTNAPRIFAMAIQPDDRLVIGGAFYYFHPHYRRGVARLEPDGTIDLSFDTGSGPEGTVYAVALLPDGKMLVGGSFIKWNGLPRRGLVRLLADGSLDPDFTADVEGGYVMNIQVAPDGRFLIGGFFALVNGQSSPGLARLLPDGSFDPSFVNPFGPSSVKTISLLADGNYLVAGSLQLPDGSSNSLVRLTPDGRVDELIMPQYAPYATASAVEADGNVLVGAASPVYSDGWSRTLVRFHPGGTPAEQIESSPLGDAIVWQRQGGLAELSGVRFELSTDAKNFSLLGHAEHLEGAWRLEGLALPIGVPITLRASGYAAAGQNGASRALYSQKRTFTLH